MMAQLKDMDPKQAELLVITQLRKNLGDIQALHKAGFNFHVQVRRLPNAAGKTLAASAPTLTWSGLKTMTHSASVPAYKLKEAHKQDVEVLLKGTDVLTAAGQKMQDNLRRENYVYPKGGSTAIEFVHPITGKAYQGLSVCHINDAFNRKRSQARAWGRIFRQVLEDSSFGVKQGKRLARALIS